ncbi:14 kDa proline-rich protein DC2.15-like [Nicotiana tabacum]|uniref:14 kDa proline-rich protein DC2.15-like n=1 Tax=Nicotiana tabacum TaxID=4097 RepID=A0A1S3Z0S4_TOBAC|nr:14 kDa proline-rich protein DC2.15-like [Nicotiana tomentosiformis]XP_016458079.1 PREDICTED: 14 kDa proline-rich protein DC2.15-like [Nicotiana tabacum]
MANFSSTIFILSLLLVATFTAACGPCSEPIKPKPSPKKAAPANPFCPRDTLKLGVCADVLGLVNVAVGSQVTSPCCSLLQGLADLEVAACLCTAIKANVLGIVKLDIPVALSALVSACAKTIPTGFKCN